HHRSAGRVAAEHGRPLFRRSRVWPARSSGHIVPATARRLRGAGAGATDQTGTHVPPTRHRLHHHPHARELYPARDQLLPTAGIAILMRGRFHIVLVSLFVAGSFWGPLSGSANAQPTTPPAPTAPTKPLPAGDDVKVETTIEAANPMHVADRATVTITITHPASATFDPIDPTRLDTGRFEVVDVTQTREEADDATAIEHIELVVTLYRVGRFYLPPLRLFFDDADGQRRYVETEQQSVKVISVVLE